MPPQINPEFEKKLRSMTIEEYIEFRKKLYNSGYCGGDAWWDYLIDNMGRLGLSILPYDEVDWTPRLEKGHNGFCTSWRVSCGPRQVFEASGPGGKREAQRVLRRCQDRFEAERDA